MTIKSMHLMMFVVYSLVIYMVALGNPRSKPYKAENKITYKYEKHADWEKDSTIVYQKKQYCEYLYNQKQDENQTSKN